MDVDARLIGTAAAALSKAEAGRRTFAAAAYDDQGDSWTEVDDSYPEVRLVARCRAADRRIAAIVSLTADRQGGAVEVRAPDQPTLEYIAGQARRHASVAVEGQWPGAVVVRPLWELLLASGPEVVHNSAREAGRFGGGMKPIAAELIALAGSEPPDAVRGRFGESVLTTLRKPHILAGARQPSAAGARYLGPAQLPQPALRHLWHAFEEASESFVFAFVDARRERLKRLTCNDADIVHVKQGFEALRNATAALFVFVGTGRRVENECPFYPYSDTLLAHGTPLHLYFAPRGNGDDAVTRLVAILNAEEGGFLAYLRQRRLFSIDLFDGGGTGGCPFVRFSAALLAGFGEAAEIALRERILIS